MSRDLPSLNALRAFEAAARLHSISLAAEELHVTHGAVSRQVRLLEDDLGVALFGKDGRGVKLTDSGVRLRDACGDAFERLRGVCAELRRQTAEAPFVLGVPGSLLARWFIPRLDQLNRALPDLRLQLSTSEGEFDPRRPGLDAMLWFAEPPWPADMQVFELAPERMGPVVSPRLAQETGLAQAPAARLLQEPLLHTASRPQAWPAWAASQGWRRRRCAMARGSSISTTCWKRRWRASAWPSPGGAGPRRSRRGPPGGALGLHRDRRAPGPVGTGAPARSACRAPGAMVAGAVGRLSAGDLLHFSGSASVH
ncbi:bacterial regulatory helix-turn-helix, lysR family protein [Pseudomonas aeruginosa]|nr:bacterial regulatory helix-turn-helix, lysR family protein [Pseudomonas aeruginosa]